MFHSRSGRISGATGNATVMSSALAEGNASQQFALVRGAGTGAVIKLAWELLRRRRKVLVSLSEPPRRVGPVRRLLLARAEAVLAAPEILEALAGRGIEISGAIAPVADPSEFLSCPCTRAASDARRIVYVGYLSPQSGVADFLFSACAWAEQQPAIEVEICWLGEGDLQGVLQAQLVPANLVQTFAAIPGRAELAAMLARCSLLVVPSLAKSSAPFVLEAMMAGLPVLGSVRSPEIRRLVSDGETGWLFDPVRPDEMLAALNTALTATPRRLDKMRAAARARGLQHTRPYEVSRGSVDGDGGCHGDQPAIAHARRVVPGGAPARA